MKELIIKGINNMNCTIQTIEKDGFIDVEILLSDKNNNHGSYLYLDKAMAQQLKNWLEEYSKL